MSPRRGRAPRGFVLPTSMLVVTLLTVMLAAAFILVSADYRTTDNTFADGYIFLQQHHKTGVCEFKNIRLQRR